MSQEPTLYSQQNPQGSTPRSHAAPGWLIRLEFFLSVLVRLFVGLYLFAAPWTPFWTANHLLLYYAPVAKIALSGITRGLISGLGILNVWIALSEALHPQER